jgi:cell wall-associated NlpC family hydrolase
LVTGGPDTRIGWQARVRGRAWRLFFMSTALALAFGCVLAAASSALALTARDYDYEIDGAGNATVTGYHGTGGTVAIPPTLDGAPVMSIGSFAFEDCGSVSSVAIPDSVTSVGNMAFHDCLSLRSAFFLGDAPAMGAGVFSGDPVTVYFIPGKAGFATPPGPWCDVWTAYLAPITTISGGPFGRWANAPVGFSLTASASPNGAGVLSSCYRLGEGEATTYAADTTVTVSAEGTTTVSYWSSDSSGDIEPTKAATVLIDETPPETSSDATAGYVGTATVSLVASDGLSGVADTQYCIGGAQASSGRIVTVAEPGGHTVEFASIDAAGNKEATRSVALVVWGPTAVRLSTKSKSGMAYAASTPVTGTLSGTGGGLPGRRVILQLSANGTTFSDAKVATTTAGGRFSFSVAPTSKTYCRVRFGRQGYYLASGPTPVISFAPQVWLTSPTAPTTMYETRYYTAYGYLKPRHTAGSYPVRIYEDRYVNGAWKSYGYVKARAYDNWSYTKYAVSLKLPDSGRWRLRAYAPGDKEHVSTWSTPSKSITVKTTGELVASIARGYVGTPYVSGGEGPGGFDCSGLVHYVYAKVGIWLPRTAHSQFDAGPRVSTRSLQPGDLVFYYEPVSHVGIYIGGGMMIDANHPGGSVGIRHLYPGLTGATRPWAR